jgi:hypothetical protein
MEKYILTFEDRNQSIVEMELSKENALEVAKVNATGKSVPLYATTFAKSKYGNCEIGRIKSITRTY